MKINQNDGERPIVGHLLQVFPDMELGKSNRFVGKNKILLVMKLTIFIMTAFLFQLSAATKAQITLNENGKTLQKVLKLISKQSGYDFIYADQAFKNAKPVTLKLNNADINKALALCFEGQPLVYEISDKTVMIKEKKFNTFLKNLMVFPVTIDIRGKIVDEKGEPVPGASITEKGTENVVSSTGTGDFTINVKDNTAVLVISYIGYQTKEILASKINNGLISLMASQESLNDVVITAYGKVKKTNLTDAVSTINAKQLENRPLRTLADGLVGLAPGLNIRIPSGAPEATPSINIRGFTGFGTSASPLILVDGIERPIQDVNPNDVESISLLKDGAATTVYGSRAPYGILLITTKSGKSGTMAVNYTSNYRFGSIALLPQSNHSYDWAGYVNQVLLANPDGTGSAFFSDLTIARMRAWAAGDFNNPVFAGIDRKYVEGGQYPDPTSSHGYTGEGTSFADINYFKEYFKDVIPSTQQNISLSGGTDKIKYFNSLGYNTINGGLKGFENYDRRYNLLSKIDIKATDWLDFNVNLNYVRQGYQGTNYRGAGIDYNTLFSVIGREYLNVPVRNPDNPNYFTSISSVGTATGAGGTRNVSKDDLNFTGGFKLHPLPGLNVNGDFTYRTVNGQDETVQKIILAYFPDGTTKPGERTANNSGINKNYSNYFYKFYNLNANYTKTLAQKHNFFAQVGVQAEDSKFRSLFGSGQSLYSPDIVNAITGTAGPYQASDRIYSTATLGYYGVFTYDYDERYLLKLAARNDATSRFAIESRWAFFPSISAGWNAAKENFWPLKKWVSQFKLRSSYSKSADLNSLIGSDPNSNSNLYTYLPTLTLGTSTQTILGGAFASVATPPGLVSSTLTWAKPTVLNIGLDITALRDRLSVTYEWYQRTVYDQAGPPDPVAQTLGTGAPRTNNSVSETRGWELSVGWNDNFKLGEKPVKYSLNFNMSDYIGYVVKYSTNITGIRSGAWTPGEQFGLNYMYQGNNIIQNRDDLYNRVIGGGRTYPGYFSYKDLNGDGLINGGATGGWYSLGDQVKNGYNYPRKSYSIMPSISWNNISLSAVFDGVMQWTQFNSGPYVFGSNGSQWFAPFYKQTTDKGFWNTDNPNAFFPAVNQGTTPNNTYALDLSHLRIRTITLGYDLPSKWLDKIKLKKANLYVTGENIGFIYSKSYVKYDPELLNVGGNGYPPMRYYSLGLNIGL